MDRIDQKIVISIFIIYIYFMYWSWGLSDSSFFLTRSLVENKQFSIDRYAEQTTDRSVYNRHYYSNKAPGLSIISVPVYQIFLGAYNILPEKIKKDEGMARIVTEFYKSEIRLPLLFNRFESWSRIVITAATSCLFVTITIVVLYEILKCFDLGNGYARLIAVIYGLGTPMFQEAITYRYHALSAMLSLTSFFLILKSKGKKNKNVYFGLAGILAGLFLFSDFTAVLTFLVLMFYVLSQDRGPPFFIFMIASAISYSPMLYYNYSITGNPIHYVGIENGDTNIFGPEVLKVGDRLLGTPNIYTVYRQLFDSYKGLFFYYPVLLLSLVGLIKMIKKRTAESLLIIGILMIYILRFSTLYIWFGTGSPVSRYLTPVIPFLILPLAFYVKEVDKRLLVALLIISIFNNFVTLQPPEYLVIEPGTSIFRPEYAAIMDSFKPLAFPLFTHYFPLFITEGPRARLVEHLAVGFWNVDIRDYAPFQPRMPPFTNLIPLAIILAFIWRREVFDKRGRSWMEWLRDRLLVIARVGKVIAVLITVYFVLMILTYTPIDEEDTVHPAILLGSFASLTIMAYLMHCIERVLSNWTPAAESAAQAADGHQI